MMPRHAGVQRWVADLNALYRDEPALHQLDFDAAGFEWIDARDAERSIVLASCGGPRTDGPVLVVCNFTPVPRTNYLVGVPHAGVWRELLNSDAAHYGGSGMGNFGGVDAAPGPGARPIPLAFAHAAAARASFSSRHAGASRWRASEPDARHADTTFCARR